ncbi:DUF1993 family protein [Marinobacter halodurans]|uniref:DUF1993 family protein n=1 Tax=Marinobacter halodurans TaxID=2528979 RepID=A0ABY1ZSV2_9GAMM|nr:DUF1993 family protein [Marinobacter halodurans]TBW58427.1 DUF1993 family protein [Marinobacter halodurans]
MTAGPKHWLMRPVAQLDHMLTGIPDKLFGESLAPDMFPLGMNAKIAANFSLRGYCPLLGRDVVSFDNGKDDKAAVIQQVRRTLHYLERLPDVSALDPDRTECDSAGFNDVRLPQPAFIHQYILPNLLFHSSMVYAIARLHGVGLGKADFDGFHSYPSDFRFVGGK